MDLVGYIWRKDDFAVRRMSSLPAESPYITTEVGHEFSNEYPVLSVNVDPHTPYLFIFPTLKVVRNRVKTALNGKLIPLRYVCVPHCDRT